MHYILKESSPTPDKENFTVTCTCANDMKEIQKKIDDLTEVDNLHKN